MKLFEKIMKKIRKGEDVFDETIKVGTKVKYKGRILIISGIYPSDTHQYLYVTNTGLALYRDEFKIVQDLGSLDKNH